MRVWVFTVLAISTIYSFSILGMVFAQQSTSDNAATLYIYSNTSWQGMNGAGGVSTSIDGYGNGQYSFDCSSGDTYSVSIHTLTNQGYLVVNIFENGKLLLVASTQAAQGTVSVAGPCGIQKTSPSNTGLVSVLTDKSSYNYGDKILVSGTVIKDLAYGNPYVKILAPDGTIAAGSSEILASDTPDKFADTISILGTVWEQGGSYRIFAQYGPSIANMTVQINPNSAVQTPTPTSFTIQSDKSSYLIGEPITISGYLAVSNSAATGTVFVMNPGFEIVDTFPVSSQNSKQFSLSLDPAKYKMTGKYIVNLNVGQGGGDVATTSFIITMTGSSVPGWIKNNAKWWSEGTVSDGEFIQAMQYLIQQGILKVPNAHSGSISAQAIPTWVKTNAEWWALGQISDDEFVRGIQYLITVGIIQLYS